MATLHYTESGQGEPLILLHSGGSRKFRCSPAISG
jgi:pimeloyl-ACP methyl ester carboxylesterase